MKNLAPIVLFTYNRLWHTKETIKALQKNTLAKESEIFIYSDGYKDQYDKQNVLKVREYLKSIKGFKKVTIIERKKNLGLANSIISGVTEILSKYDKIIVLEDDLVTNKCFLSFMNDSLEIYKKHKNIGQIHGHIYNIEGLPELFFHYKSGCLGWGIWKDRWDQIDFNTAILIQQIKEKKLEYKFDIDGAYPYFQMLVDNLLGKNDSWAIRFYANLFLKDLLTLYPGKSLVQHIGIEQGTHCKGRKQTHPIDGVLTKECIKSKYIKIENSIFAEKKLQKFFLSLQSDKKKRFKDLDYQKLIKTPRFQEVEVEFLGKSIKAPDSASLLFLNRELFGNEIYKFKADSKEPFIIDGGANIGLSIIYFKMLYPKAKIIAFEADLKIFEYLKFNIDSFGFDDVILINKALWDEETTLEFFSEGSDGGRIATKEDKEKITKVETTKLSNYLQNGKVDFLKLDVEGAEYRILLEIQDYLKNIDNIFIEYHSFFKEKQVLEKILTLLSDNGFRYYIGQTGIKSMQPFVKINTTLGMDIQLNIFGYKK